MIQKNMIHFLRKITPKKIVTIYHFTLSFLASLIYRNPSSKMIVIGVTGTNGKSSTAYFLSQLLETSGYETGLISTALIKIGRKENLNDLKMTMPGRFALQRLMSEMVKAGCRYAVIETSSQGIEQYRHRGVSYDYVVFTNLTPEHIEAHGGYDNYKKAKGKLFAHLGDSPRKNIDGRNIPKTIIANIDDNESSYFLSFDADRKIGFTLNSLNSPAVTELYHVDSLASSREGVCFNFESNEFLFPIIGSYHSYNLAAALAVCYAENLSLDALSSKAKILRSVPGRMELINMGQNFSVLVDYAPEPYALEATYKSLADLEYNRLIHVLGSCGGGRDVARRPVLGAMAGKKADLVIVTNEDPYNDDPMEIIKDVAAGAIDVGKKEGLDLLIIENRKEAIEQALAMATDGDLVLITGKGCEQFIMGPKGEKIMHDDREVVRDFFNR